GQVDLGFRAVDAAHAAAVVAGGGADADLLVEHDAGGLADRAAGVLHLDAGVEQVGDEAVAYALLVDRQRRGRNVEPDSRGDLAAAQHAGGDLDVFVVAVGAGAEPRLVDPGARDLVHRHHVVEPEGLGDLESEGVAVQVDDLRVTGVGISGHRGERLVRPGPDVVRRLVVGAEEAELGDRKSTRL